MIRIYPFLIVNKLPIELHGLPADGSWYYPNFVRRVMGLFKCTICTMFAIHKKLDKLYNCCNH